MKLITKKLIGTEAKALSNLIHRKFEQSKTKSTTNNLSGLQSWIIGYLYENSAKDIFQRDIEVAFSVRPSTAARTLKLMEDHDLITRESVENDARLKKLRLTQTAIVINETIIKDIDKLESQLIQGITKEELETFFHIIDKMKSNIED